MAAACIFSLAQSGELCTDIAESGAADLALEDLANGGRPRQAGQKESEFLLAQLAVVAQVIKNILGRELSFQRDRGMWGQGSLLPCLPVLCFLRRPGFSSVETGHRFYPRRGGRFRHLGGL